MKNAQNKNNPHLKVMLKISISKIIDPTNGFEVKNINLGQKKRITHMKACVNPN